MSGEVETTTCSTGGITTFGVGLVAGTFSALFCKIAYQTTSEGLDGEEKLFSKPIAMLFLMFAAMSPGLIFWLIQQSFLAPKDRETVSYKTMAILIVPSICDLLCTLLLLIAQLYITASMWQMLRGSVIVITALLKKFLLNHRLRIHMWVGVAIIALSMVLVAATSFIGPAETPATTTGQVKDEKDPRIGVLLVLAGCLAQGVQYVFEEKVMAVDNAPPLVVIGCEGLWGTVVTLCLVYPIAYILPGKDNGSFENPWDAIEMVKKSPQLQNLLMGFVVTVTIYNCMAVYVTKYLSAIWHAILDNFRPVTIWATDLYIFYVLLPNSGFGEAWIPASWLQLAGLLVLFVGTAMYDGRVMVWPDDSGEYAPLAVEMTGLGGSSDAGDTMVIKGVEPGMNFAALSRSPLVHRDARTSPAPAARAGTGSKKGYNEI